MDVALYGIGLSTPPILRIIDFGGEGNENIVLILGGFAIFNVLVNAGPNSTTWTLPTELFPTSLRGSASGLAAASGKLGAAVGIFLLPLLGEAWGLAPVRVAVAGVSIEVSPIPDPRIMRDLRG